MRLSQERRGWVRPAVSGLLAGVALSSCGGLPRPTLQPSRTPESQAICNELQVMLISEQLGQWVVGASVVYTVTGDADVRAVDYTFGDGDTAEIPSDQFTQVVHTYSRPGTYDISARLKGEQDGRPFLTSSDKRCAVQLKVSPPPPSPPA